MERKFTFSVGEYYHVYNRGVDKRTIFESTDEYRRFLTLLYLCNSTQSVNISELEKRRSLYEMCGTDTGDDITALGAHVSMPNHFHLLAKETVEGGLSKFIGKVSTGYSMYFNKKHNRSGSLFQGRFQAKHIQNDEYLKYIFAYTHLNPIKLIEPNWKESGIKNKLVAQDFLSRYSYSSYFDYIGIQRLEQKILNKKAFPNYFNKVKDFNDFILDWLSYRDDKEF